MFKAVAVYFFGINLLGMILNITDKQKAKRHQWRIKERTLWGVALLGGAPFSYLTMLIIRHKTQHKSFMIGMPILAVADIVLFINLSTLLLK